MKTEECISFFLRRPPSFHTLGSLFVVLIHPSLPSVVYLIQTMFKCLQYYKERAYHVGKCVLVPSLFANLISLHSIPFSFPSTPSHSHFPPLHPILTSLHSIPFSFPSTSSHSHFPPLHPILTSLNSIPFSFPSTLSHSHSSHSI